MEDCVDTVLPPEGAERTTLAAGSVLVVVEGGRAAGTPGDLVSLAAALVVELVFGAECIISLVLEAVGFKRARASLLGAATVLRVVAVEVVPLAVAGGIGLGPAVRGRMSADAR